MKRNENPRTFKKEILLTKKAKQEWLKWKKTAQYKPIVNIENHDTIGMLAIDNNGNISGACTTSGMAYKIAGRVGDSPIIGAGLFVDNEVGGATATGVGEEVVRTVGSFLIVELMRQGKSPQEACEEGVRRIIKKNKNKLDFQIGFIAINKKIIHFKRKSLLLDDLIIKNKNNNVCPKLIGSKKVDTFLTKSPDIGS